MKQASATGFTAADFAATKNVMVFATGPNSTFTARPSRAHIEAWNRRVRLPPAGVAAYFADSFRRVEGVEDAVKTRIIFSLKDGKKDPSILFEVWRKDAVLPKKWDGSNLSNKVFRANRHLQANKVYGMWCGVTEKFNDGAGGQISLRQRGVTKAIQATLMPLFMAMGYKKFELHASSDDSHNGAYVWPRFGAETQPKVTQALVGQLRQSFNAIAKTTDIPASIARRVNKVLDHPDSRLLARLTDIRYKIADPAHPGKKAQLADVMARDLYIKCHFDFESAAWQKRFFAYAGDRRADLQRHLAREQQKSPS